MLFVHLFYSKLTKYWIFVLVGFLFVVLNFIPIKIAIAHYQSPYPQAILTLGGGPEREKFTAQFAKNYPNLDIWVSTGILPAQAFAIFHDAGISTDRIHLDYRAVDTVTNFTSLVEDLYEQHIKHVYLITSDFHIPRATTIATLVLGSKGITFTPVTVPTERPQESIFPLVRDAGRSILWIISGRTGSSFHLLSKGNIYARN
ncbi:MAG: YdcF family protein [Nostocales cyanobacterium]|nr:MAG: YdcF family protein [Nostocales cyanobacterium]